ncbi:hypothetical protein RchiOBHm_Chr4g0438941 [Rosa chinensis]|uniref:Uncharacterized protein n=1 Tax=Rosa chinensis TaxID=74649 RepID=A0A2P6R2N1_ROSCH|nr:hypothetical protein RchiOBHm_Chr4g0438941 [Rosa chinensis]
MLLLGELRGRGFRLKVWNGAGVGFQTESLGVMALCKDGRISVRVVELGGGMVLMVSSCCVVLRSCATVQIWKTRAGDLLFLEGCATRPTCERCMLGQRGLVECGRRGRLQWPGGGSGRHWTCIHTKEMMVGPDPNPVGPCGFGFLPFGRLIGLGLWPLA